MLSSHPLHNIDQLNCVVSFLSLQDQHALRNTNKFYSSVLKNIKPIQKINSILLNYDALHLLSSQLKDAHSCTLKTKISYPHKNWISIFKSVESQEYELHEKGKWICAKRSMHISEINFGEFNETCMNGIEIPIKKGIIINNDNQETSAWGNFYFLKGKFLWNSIEDNSDAVELKDLAIVTLTGHAEDKQHFYWQGRFIFQCHQSTEKPTSFHLLKFDGYLSSIDQPIPIGFSFRQDPLPIPSEEDELTPECFDFLQCVVM
jgi:hypothetical protein